MSVGDLAVPLPALSPAATCAESLTRMEVAGAHGGLAVVDGGVVRGLVSRTALMHHLAHPVTHALYEQRPVTLLMRTDPLTVDAATSIERVNELIAADDPATLDEGVIVTRDGRYLGMCTVPALLQRAAIDARAQLAEVEAARDEAQRANRAKTTFLANLSHELRTPLNAIMGFADLMASGATGPLTAKQQEYLGDIHASGRHLLSLISDLLDLSRAESGRTKLDPTDVRPAALLDETTRLVRMRARQRGIELRIDGTDAPAIRGD